MQWLLLWALLLASNAQEKGEKPWERKVQVPVPVPMQLPEVPATNPFYRPLVALPQAKQTPMREDFPITVPVSFSLYLTKEGECRRAHPLTNPMPGVLEPLRQELLQTTFTPAKAFGGAVATWLDVGVNLQGEIKEGKAVQLMIAAPDPAQTPTLEAIPTPPPDPKHGQLPATPAQQLTAFPAPKRFSAKVPSQQFRQPFRLLLEVGAEGKVKRVLFLLCPEGLRSWVLASSGSWLFTPPQGAQGPVGAWVVVQGLLEVRVGTLRAEGLRVGRLASYPAPPQ